MKPQLFTLDNGLRVLLEENHAAPVIALQALVTVGSADETDEEAGICHLIEHMLFKGTQKRKVGQIAKDVEMAGGDINAYTSFDQTVYYINMARRFADEGLDILADAVQNPTFDKTELEREKEVILEEIRRERDNPSRHIGEILFQKAFDRHTYGRPIIGFEKTVKAVSRDFLFQFHHRWYIPENVFFLVIGDFESKKMLQKVSKAFRHFKNRNITPCTTPRRKEHPQKKPKFVFQGDNIQSLHYALSFHIPPIVHDDIAALDILSHILGGTQSSRLVHNVKEKKRLVQNIHAYAYAPKDPGLFIIGGQCQSRKGPKAFEAVFEEIERMKQEGPSQEELAGAKLNILAMETYEKETVGGQAGKYAYFLATADDFEFEQKYYPKVQATPADEVMRVCHHYLTPGNMTAALLVPHKDFDKSWESQIRKSLLKDPKVVVRKTKGDPGKKERAECLRMANGVRLILQEDHSLPIFAICLATDSGLHAETKETNGIHHLMAHILTKGTKKKSALQVAQAVDAMAGSLEGFSGKNTYGLKAEFMSEYLEKGLDLFFEVLLEPAWDSQQIAKDKKLVLEAIQNQEDALSQLVFYHFQKALFPKHPYGMRTIGSTKSIPKITPKKMSAHHKRALMGKETVVGLVGDFKTRDVVAILKDKLSALPAKKAQFKTPKIDPKPSRPKTVTIHKEKEQAHLVLGFRANKLNSPDHYPMTVMNNILAGMGGRLFVELRDRQSMAYTVTSLLVEGIETGYFGAYIGTEPSKVERAINAIRKELKTMTREKVTMEEVKRTVRYMVGTYELSLQRNATLAQAFTFNELYGLGFREVYRYPGKVLKVTREDILRVAKKYIDLEASVLAEIKPK